MNQLQLPGVDQVAAAVAVEPLDEPEWVTGAVASREDLAVFDVPRPRVSTKREAILSRDGWACRYCGTAVSLRTAHVDHVIPHSRGGSSDADNLVAACARCNLAKGARTPKEWLQ